METSGSQKKRRVLFLCTGNSCRSQIAEALVNHYLGDRWEAFSAGTQPAGFVHSSTTNVLAEIGIHHHGRSKSVDQFIDQPFDLVITVCDDAAENCPVWLGKGKRVHISYPDPGQAPGGDEEKVAVARKVRERMLAEIIPLLADGY